MQRKADELKRMNALLEKERLLDERLHKQSQDERLERDYEPRLRERDHRVPRRERVRQDRERRREERQQRVEDRKLRRRGIEPEDYDEPSRETELDPYAERIIMDKYMQRHKGMKKSERKLIAGKEMEGTKSRQNSVMYLAVIGLAFISFIYFYIKIDWMSIILLYVGLMMFIPVGMILGWAFLDPYMRCKIMRRTTHKNYGIVNFVGKGQKIVSKIKNFDDSLIWRGNSVWAITKEHIYQLSKNGDQLSETGKIDAESIVTLVETVPVLFVDLDSMQPLGLARDRREGINPLELGPALKSWVDNEKAKAIGLRKTMDMFFIVLIILAIVSVGMAYLSMNNVNDLMTQVSSMQNRLDALIQQINATGLP